MASPYLELPLRTLAQATMELDRARVVRRFGKLAKAHPPMLALSFSAQPPVTARLTDETARKMLALHIHHAAPRSALKG